MSANLCVESHLRELLEQGFEVAVVKDATAGAIVDEGDGFEAAMVNFRFLANAVWTTDEAVDAIKHSRNTVAASVRVLRAIVQAELEAADSFNERLTTVRSALERLPEEIIPAVLGHEEQHINR
jgi:hypothetical protein